MIKSRLILLVFFLFINGCAQQIQQQSVPKKDWQQQLSHLQHFSISGKLAFISTKKRQSANFHWLQNNENYQLKLTSFIGTQILQLQRTAEQAELEIDGNYHQDNNAQALIARLTGWILPLDNSANWLKGDITPTEQTRDQFGRLLDARWQSPSGEVWQISYANYIALQGVWLPQSITLTQQGVKIKIKISTWQFS